MVISLTQMTTTSFTTKKTNTSSDLRVDFSQSFSIEVFKCHFPIKVIKSFRKGKLTHNFMKMERIKEKEMLVLSSAVKRIPVSVIYFFLFSSYVSIERVTST